MEEEIDAVLKKLKAEKLLALTKDCIVFFRYKGNLRTTKNYQIITLTATVAQVCDTLLLNFI